METLVVNPRTKKELKFLKEFLVSENINFTENSNGKSPYNPEFVKMVQQADEDFRTGKNRGRKIDIEDLWK